MLFVFVKYEVLRSLYTSQELLSNLQTDKLINWLNLFPFFKGGEFNLSYILLFSINTVYFW